MCFFLTETFCTSKIPDSFYKIQGYELYHKDRFGRSGGGILAFVNEQLCVNFRSDSTTNVTEVLWLEIFPFKSKRSLLIAGVYRLPSSTRSDDINLGKNIERGYLKNKETIILGDFNINSLDSNKFCKHNLIKTMKNLHFSQHVNEVTRPASNSCLDHVWTSHSERIATVEVKTIGLSDHLPTVIVRRYKRAMNNNRNDYVHTTISYRNLKHVNEKEFIKALDQAPWDTAFIFDEINDIVDAWYQIFNDVLDTYAPIKQKRVKRVSQPRWFNDDLNHEIQKRDHHFKKAKKSQKTEDWKHYKSVKNKVNELVGETK